MVGTHIVPLSELGLLDRALFEKERSKYDGREALMQETIPPLGCLWNEAVFLSPVHPVDILDELAQIDESMSRRDFFKIDASILDPALTTIWLHEGDKKTPDMFLPFRPEELCRYSKIPERTLRFYRLRRSRGLPILIFAGIPHVLYKGRIDVSAAEIISV
jgi:hypothetical protein